MFGRVVGLIIEHAPFAIGMAERFLGSNSGAAKKVAAAKEITEFISELIEKDPAEQWTDLDEFDIANLVAALEDEEAFVGHIMDVNDAIVGLINYVNSKGPTE